jgi:hypothetical protein
MWCDQNNSVPHSWFGAERFQGLFRAAVEGFGGNTPQQWDEHIFFLRSEEGSDYDRRLSERFDEIRKGRVSSPALPQALNPISETLFFVGTPT